MPDEGGAVGGAVSARRWRPGSHDWLPPRRWPWALGGVLALALIAGGVVAAVKLPPLLACGTLTDGMVEQDGECVGVTDGSYRFAFDAESAESGSPAPGDAKGGAQRDRTERAMRRVQEKIKKENDGVSDKADKGRAAVTLALLTTLTPDATSPLTPQRVLRSVEGAYVAQKRANDTKELGDRAPLIRLVLANAGSRQQLWRKPVEQLAGMRDDKAPLVAVTGFGISSEETRDAAEKLSDEGIPMVSSVASADGLNNDRIPGLIRVTPSNTDFAKALRAYARDRDPRGKVMLIYDSRTSDLHVRTLKGAYEEVFGDRLTAFPSGPFQGTTLQRNSDPPQFNDKVRNVCQGRPAFVLFAGRPADLEEFLKSLEERNCLTQPVKVLFVETGEVISPARAERLGKRRITVVQASASDPGWAPGGGPEVPRGFAEFDKAYKDFLPDTDVDQALRNGYAVGHHDALVTAIDAARLSYAQDKTKVTTGLVKQKFFDLNISNKVEAASGTLSFTAGTGGNPGGKPVPVQEMPPGKKKPPLYTTPR